MMKDEIDKDTAKTIYSGSRFKSYLKRNKISYKDAADELGIDKNTVAKAVRGGNLNIDVILRICNVYHLDITDLFMKSDSEGRLLNANYYLSTGDFRGLPPLNADDSGKYKKCEKFDEQVKIVSNLIDHSKSVLDELAKQYDECRRVLDEMIKLRSEL